MRKRISVVAVAVVALGALFALAQDAEQNGTNGSEAPPVDEALFDQGEQMFETNCAVCHQSDGQGNPPTFPALDGNENLQDVALIATTIHNGRGAMPAFPQFDAEQVAALATYIRNAWSNDFGGVNVDEVAAQLEDDEAEDGDEAADGEDAAEGEEAQLRSVWDGVYTSEQVERGRPVYSRCGQCHGQLRVTSATEAPAAVSFGPPSATDSVLMHVTDPGNFVTGPPIAGPIFLRNWDGSNVGSLFEYTRTTMPQDNPGSLSDQEYIDVIAFMFAASDLPEGDEELPPEVEPLQNIVIEEEPDDSEDGAP